MRIRMCKKIAKILIISCLALNIAYSQTNNQEQPNYETAQAILKKSQEAIYQKVKRAQIKTIILRSRVDSVAETVNKIEGEANPRELRTNYATEDDILFEIDDKLNQTTFSYNANKNS